MIYKTVLLLYYNNLKEKVLFFLYRISLIFFKVLLLFFIYCLFYLHFKNIFSKKLSYIKSYFYLSFGKLNYYNF